MPSKKMKIWTQNTFYSGFGFQIHFNTYVEFKNEWCWSCNDDWTVIILPVSNWLKNFDDFNNNFNLFNISGSLSMMFKACPMPNQPLMLYRS